MWELQVAIGTFPITLFLSVFIEQLVGRWQQEWWRGLEHKLMCACVTVWYRAGLWGWVPWGEVTQEMLTRNGIHTFLLTLPAKILPRRHKMHTKRESKRTVQEEPNKAKRKPTEQRKQNKNTKMAQLTPLQLRGSRGYSWYFRAAKWTFSLIILQVVMSASHAGGTPWRRMELLLQMRTPSRRLCAFNLHGTSTAPKVYHHLNLLCLFHISQKKNALGVSLCSSVDKVHISVNTLKRVEFDRSNVSPKEKGYLTDYELDDEEDNATYDSKHMEVLCLG